MKLFDKMFKSDNLIPIGYTTSSPGHFASTVEGRRKCPENAPRISGCFDMIIYVKLNL
jgi:hypothetical protein